MAEEFMGDEIDFDVDELFSDLPTEGDSEADRALINAPDPETHTRIAPDRLAALEQAQRVIDQFNSNPLQAITQIAQQMGMEIRPRGDSSVQQPAETTPQSRQQQIEDMIEEPSMKFLAPMIAKVAEKIAEQKVRETIEPLQRTQQEIATRNRQQEYVSAAQELGSKYPDWQGREADMQARLEFIRGALNGGPLKHHKYGNVLEMLYSWASGNNHAVREVAERYRQAPRQRGVTSQGDRATQPDILKSISKIQNPRDQFKTAWDAAVKEVMG